VKRFPRIASAIVIAVAGRAGGVLLADAGPPPVYELGDPIFHAVADARSIPENDVTALAQDAAGFLWIGTPDGLVRYDGYTFRVFRRDPNDPRSLVGNGVRTIRAAADGRVWIGSNTSGVAVFDPRTETFASIPEGEKALASDAIRGFAESKEGMWVATTKGLHLVEPATLRVTRVECAPKGKPSAPRKNLGSMLLDRRGDLWLGSADGLSVRRGDGRLESVADELLSGKPIYRLFEAADGAIWIALFGGGLVKLDPATAEAKLLDAETRPLALAQPEPQTVWVGTTGDGIEVRDATTGALRKRHRRDVSVKESLVSSRISALRLDRSGLLWIGTVGGGLARYSPPDAAFQLMKSSPARPDGLTNSEVESLFESSDGLLWVGTHDNGVDVFDARHRVAGYRAGGAKGQTLDIANVGAITETRDGAMWIGTFAAIHRLDRKSGRIERFAAEAYGKTTGRITSLTPAADGSGVWVGATGGLAFFDTASGVAAPALYEDGSKVTGNVADVTYDKSGVLWIAHGGGLGTLAAGKGRFHRLSTDQNTSGTLPRAGILDLLHDSRGGLWLGMSRGMARLVSYDGVTARFESVGERLGLQNKRCDNLEEDGSGRIWIEDDAVFDPATFALRTFTPDEGAGRSIWRGAAVKTRSGQIVLGGPDGLFFIDPGALRPWDFAPPVRITALRVDGHPLPPAARAELELPPRTKTLSLEFAALDLSAPRRNRYAYRLRGFDPDFVEVDAEHRGATYTALPPGSYVFELRGSNREGVFTRGSFELPVRVLPAWYQTTLFKLAAGLFLVGLTWPVYRLRLRVLERHQAELEALVARRTSELQVSELKARAASEAKSVFLANMSHELRTPLNAVLGFAQLLRRSPSLGPADRENLSIIHRSGEHLLSLINQVLSISKIEAGKMTLDEAPFDLGDLVRTLERMLRARAEEAGLAFRAECGALPEAVLGDAGKLRQALLNLLGNAVKFTRAGGVTLRVRWESGRGHFEVSDTGMGISAEELPSLFTPFVQTESGRVAKEGTGLGLAITKRIVELMGGSIAVESAPGQGTTFRFDAALPRCEARTAPAATRRVLRLAPGSPSPRVLVADDTPENRRLLVTLLDAVGLEVREAEDGAVALRVYREWKPDLVFMDMRMPVMDGREAIRSIRREEKEAGRAPVHIVALTASVYEHEADAVKSEGADEVVFKPYREEQIFAALEARHGVLFVREDEPAPAAARPAPASRRGARRVLLTDDDAISRALAREVLASEGYEVLEATNGLEALERLAVERVDAVLLDVEMPQLGGLETVRRIRADARLRGLPVLALTAHDEPESLAALRAGGMDEHVVKPFDPDELLSKLSALIQNGA